MARRRATSTPSDRCCPDPLVEGGRVRFDWRGHRVGDRPAPCRICRSPALMRDCTERPCHKTCAEAEHGRDLAHAAGRYALRGA